MRAPAARHCLAAASWLVPACVGSDARVDGDSGPPVAGLTWWDDVRPIVVSRCEPCHAPTGMAALPLDTPEAALAWSEAIHAAVDEGRMPPWPPSADCAELAAPRRLDDTERATLLAWLDGPSDVGHPPATVDGTTPHVPLDVEVTMAEAYTPPEGADTTRCFALPWRAEADEFVTALEVVPGASELVHHAIVTASLPDVTLDALDAADPGPGWTCSGSFLPSEGPLLGTWLPGDDVRALPEGTGIRVEAGSGLVLTVHYSVVARPSRADLSSVRLGLTPTVEREAWSVMLSDPRWLLPGGMLIPAGEASVVHDASVTPTLVAALTRGALPTGAPFAIHEVRLHMHALGASARLGHEDPAGDACLLDVPDWDVHWQGQYSLVEPETIQWDDAISLRCTWRNDAPGAVDVGWGVSTADEMCSAGVLVTAVSP